jgi:hypothetical protein
MIKGKYQLNNLQIISFKNFIENTQNKQLLQYIGGATNIGKTQIIKTVQN